MKVILNYIGMRSKSGCADEFFVDAKYSQARKIYLEAWDKKPDSLTSVQLRNLAYTYYIDGDYPRSIFYLDKGLSIDPAYSDAWRSKGLSLAEWGKQEESKECYLQSLSINPKDALAHLALVRLFINNKSYGEALDACDRLIQISPSLISALCCKLRCLRALSRDDDADLLLNDLNLRVANQNQFIFAFINELINQKLHDDLVRSCDIILSTQDSVYALYGKACALYYSGSLVESLTFCNLAISKGASFFEIISLKGVIEYELGNFSNAENSYKQAIKLRPSHSDSRWNLSLLYLSRGQYRKGLDLYEYRYAPGSSKRPHLTLSMPCWNGNLFRLDKPLLIVSEQGLGDTIQFIRYSKFIKEKFNVDIMAAVPPSLVDLLSSSGVANSVVSYLDIASVDVAEWIPLMSLPRLLGVRPHRPLISSNYLSVTSQKSIQWAADMRKNSKQILIGLHWKGNAEMERGALRGRSLSLCDFRPLGAIEGINYVLLQKKCSSDEFRDAIYFDLIECQDRVTANESFVDTAAQLKACDIVITNDTSIAHLSGSLGVPTWILLHSMPDWRWGVNSSKTFWYDSVSLFRQEERGGWTKVINKVAKKLYELTKDK